MPSNPLPPPLLRVQDLHVSYGEHSVLRGLSFEVKSGEVLAVIGGSGSGKTTLLRCLNLLTLPDKGQIDLGAARFQTTKETQTDQTDWHQEVGIVFQQFHLWPHKTVLENLMLAPTKLGLKSADAIEQEALIWLERVGLKDKAASYPLSLSGGQQQRVALARALILKPKLLLLDEITSALDPELVGDVKKLIRTLIQETGITCILVTHDLGFVRELADRVLFIDQGKILERGTPEQILDRPKEERTKQFVKRVNG